MVWIDLSGYTFRQFSSFLAYFYLYFYTTVRSCPFPPRNPPSSLAQKLHDDTLTAPLHYASNVFHTLWLKHGTLRVQAEFIIILTTPWNPYSLSLASTSSTIYLYHIYVFQIERLIRYSLKFSLTRMIIIARDMHKSPVSNYLNVVSISPQPNQLLVT